MVVNTDFIYPVGSIYINMNRTNPHDLFGGIWEQIKGRFLFAEFTNQGIQANTSDAFGTGGITA